MANYIGQCITPRVSSDHIAKVKVPVGGLNAGEVVVCDTLDNTISRNLEVYVGAQPAAGNITSKHLAVVVNGGFETLADGRRPDGQPDFTKYSYKEGEIATVVFLDAHLFFEISVDSVGNGKTAATPASDIGKYLIPEDGTNALKVNVDNNGVGGSLKIMAIRNFPIGGLYGAGFCNTYICVAQ